ncbi:MAG: hypothetical protein OXT70_01280, partial [Chloroflexota bacterium]|nr:hypothetical protein [Chloroflexota bacterium]
MTAKIEINLGGAWTDVSARARGFRVRHGGRYAGDPSRRTLLQTSGSLALLADGLSLPQSPRPCRLSWDGVQVWSGLAERPDGIPSFQPEVSLRLTDATVQAAAKPIDVDIPAGKVSALFGADALGGAFGSFGTSGIPDRDARAVEFTGPAGLFAAQAAAAASAVLVTTADGTPKAVYPALSAAPAGGFALTGPDILRIRTQRLTDQVRNTVIAEFANYWTRDWSRTLSRRVNFGTRIAPSPWTLTLPISGIGLPEGATATAWTAEIIEANVTRWGRTLRIPRGSPTRPPNLFADYPIIDTVPATGVSATATVSGGNVTLQVTWPTQPVYTVLRDTWRFGVPPPPAPILETWYLDRTQEFPSSGGTGNYTSISFTVRLSAQVAGGSAGTTEVRVSEAVSVGEWGEQPISFPDWAFAADPAAARRQAGQLLGLLKDPGTVHQVDVPLGRGGSQLIDTGDFVRLDAVDSTVGVDVRQWCLCVQRELDIRPGRLPIARLWLMETGLASG